MLVLAFLTNLSEICVILHPICCLII